MIKPLDKRAVKIYYNDIMKEQDLKQYRFGGNGNKHHIVYENGWLTYYFEGSFILKTHARFENYELPD